MIVLYKKTHRKTRLKYLGKTVQDPYDYQGSGKHWSNHINKHRYDVDTEILLETDDPKEIKKWGLYYSELWNVVESKEWANLKPESGDGGWEHVNDDQEFRKAKNKKARASTNKVLKEKYGDDYASIIGKAAVATAKENKVGIFADDYVPYWQKNPEAQQLGNTPSARAKAVVTQKKTFKKIKHQQGTKNSQYGTRWINNGIRSTKISSNEMLPEGWQYGRICR